MKLQVDYTDVKNPMTAEMKSYWVKALRSGVFKQGVGQLCERFKDGTLKHCCLGVANAIFDLQQNDRRATLQDHVAEAMLVIPADIQVQLYKLNDEDHKTFAEIADFIEANIPAIDEV